MERYLTRVCWNDCDWRRPCGHPLGSSYVEKHGFGFEEWFNRDDVSLKGLRYAFIQGVSRSQERLQDEEIALDLFTISKARIPYLVARLNGARVLSHEESLAVTSELQRRKVLKRMRSEVAAVGQPTSSAQFDKERAIFNLCFKPNALAMLTPPKELLPSAVQGRMRFQLYRSVPLEHRLSGGTTNKKKESSLKQRQFAEAKQLLLLENQMQNELFDLLARQFGKDRVVREREHVDITVLSPSGAPQYLIEVKSAEEPRLAVRAALGQLLEYAHYPGHTLNSPSMKLIIAARGVLDQSCRKYLQRLKTRYRFNVEYRHYEPGTHTFML